MRLLNILTVKRFKVEQIYYNLYFIANKDKVIYRELLIIWDAIALYCQVVIKFYILKDVKARARHYNKEDKQYSNTEPWQNPYNNILNDLFKDLNNKSTKSLKAAI